MPEAQVPSSWSGPLVLTVVLAIAAGAFYLAVQKDESRAPVEKKTDFQNAPMGRLPDDWTIADLHGKKIRLRDFEGKIVFLNRWATWCRPCLAEMPSIQALYESLKGSNIAFVLLTDEAPEKVRAFVKKRNWFLPVYVTVQPLPPILRSGAYPTTFVINKKREVIFREKGAKDWNTDAVRQFLKKVS